MRFATRKTKTAPRGGQLNIGFVPTIDCAVLIAAQELGLFQKHGLAVRLSREVGWATIREKLLHEEIHAAATHASMLFSIYCGIGVVRRSCLTGLFLSSNGSAITLSNELWEMGARDAATTGDVIRRSKGSRTFTFGAVLDLSTQHYNLRQWLASGGVDSEREIRLVTIPSALIYDSFRQGFLDGYCVAEPWNSMAVLDKTGWVAATSSEIAPQRPEKVLLVLQAFAEQREEEHLRLIAALVEASEFCDAPACRPELARMLSQRKYFEVSPEYLANSLVGPFNSGRGVRPVDDFVVFNAFKAGAPNRARGQWVFDLVRQLGPAGSCAALRRDVIAKVFRQDIYEKAVDLFRAARRAPGGSAPAPGSPANGERPHDIEAKTGLFPARNASPLPEMRRAGAFGHAPSRFSSTSSLPNPTSNLV